MILNPDGTPFKLAGSLQQFNPGGSRKELFNKWDAEAILIGGSPLLYYEVFIQLQTVDKLYLEDRGKLWSPIPVTLHGYYEPIEPQNPSTAFGIDGIGEVVFECNYAATIKALGHDPKRGSRIHTPHLGEDWIVVDVRRTQFAYWGALHYQIVCERFQESSTTGEGAVENAKVTPDYTIS